MWEERQSKEWYIWNSGREGAGVQVLNEFRQLNCFNVGAVWWLKQCYKYQLQWADGSNMIDALSVNCEGVITCSMSAWGEWMKMETLSFGEDSRQSWASVARGL